MSDFWQGQDASMQEVRCRECGESLGYQGAGEVAWELWEHNRCPVRLARNLGVDAELYDQMRDTVKLAIVGAYPEFPHNTIGDHDMDLFRLFRAGIAAEMVLEALGKLEVKRRQE
jgi:hypothetical protein